MADFKIPRIRYTWKGTWSSGLTYVKDDVIHYSGKSYVCMLGHTASSAILTDITASKWVLMLDGQKWRGLWDTNTLYNPGDIVNYGPNTYRCLVSHTSVVSASVGIEDAVQEGKWEIHYQAYQYRGTWDTGVRYKFNDIVRYGGTLWKCLLANTSGSFLGDISYWAVYLDGLQYENSVWSGSTVYQQGDVVSYGGYSYRALVSHTAQVPPTSPSYWSLVTEDYRFRGDWNPAISYLVGDTVRQNGYLYVAITNSSVKTVTVTSATANTFEAAVGTVLLENLPIVFSGISFAGIVSGKVYYIKTIVDSQHFTVSDYPSGPVTTLISEAGTMVGTTNPSPPFTPYWKQVNLGHKWRGIWANGVNYELGDIATFGSTSYESLTRHTSDVYTRPDYDVSGSSTTWKIYVEGNTSNVLTNQGDLFYYNNGAKRRLPIGTDGSILKVTGDKLSWASFGIINKVYYVATSGTDDIANGYGLTLDKPFKTVRYACLNVTGPATIFIKTGVFSEVLPISVPANVALVGDELRSTVIQPAGIIISGTDVPYSIAALTRLITILPDVIQNNPIAKSMGNPIDQDTITMIPGSEDAALFAAQVLTDGRNWIDYYINNNGLLPAKTGSNSPINDDGYTDAADVLDINTEFLVNEAVAYINHQYPAYAGNYNETSCKRDIREFIKALIHDVVYIGNYRTVVAADSYVAAVLGSANRNMFYLRNGCGLRNMTLSGLSGSLSALNQYLTRRPTGGAYVSLDPGFGTADTSVQITTKSPYVQNVTTFGTACIGLKVDGSLHNSGNKSIVANDFTQVLSDGIGAWVTNNARVELVSVFTYYNYIGYLAENGGKIRATNGNNSYGNYGSVAEGYDTSETLVTASVNNRYQHADVGFVFTNGSQIISLEYNNAGQTYSTASYTFSGSGTGAATNAISINDGAVYQIRITDPLNSNFPGGGGYLYVVNNAQSGTAAGTIILSTNDVLTSTNYLGMRVVITSGTGAGQYGYITAYDSGTKVASINKESTLAAGWDHFATGTTIVDLDSTSRYSIEPRVVIAPPGSGATAVARATVASGRIGSIRIINPGTGYTVAPTVTLTDPNATTPVTFSVRIGDGVLGQPTYTSRGTGYITASATVTGNGYADNYQSGAYMWVNNLTYAPTPGANISITGISDTVYRLVTIDNITGTAPNLSARLRLGPYVRIFNSPAHAIAVSIRQQYSQVRLTGHDFLDIGTGNISNTNYPGLPYNGKSQPDEVVESGGGRVFYTSTDQDGNFRVGELFRVEQATGIVSLSADSFDLSGLSELRLGGVILGGTGAVIREFSTDGTFTANSNNIVSTQKAIKSYITAQIGGGTSNVFASSLTAGVINISLDTITTTTNGQISINRKTTFTGGVTGTALAMSYFTRS